MRIRVGAGVRVGVRAGVRVGIRVRVRVRVGVRASQLVRTEQGVDDAPMAKLARPHERRGASVGLQVELGATCNELRDDCVLALERRHAQSVASEHTVLPDRARRHV